MKFVILKNSAKVVRKKLAVSDNFLVLNVGSIGMWSKTATSAASDFTRFSTFWRNVTIYTHDDRVYIHLFDSINLSLDIHSL